VSPCLFFGSIQQQQQQQQQQHDSSRTTRNGGVHSSSRLGCHPAVLGRRGRGLVYRRASSHSIESSSSSSSSCRAADSAAPPAAATSGDYDYVYYSSSMYGCARVCFLPDDDAPFLWSWTNLAQLEKQCIGKTHKKRVKGDGVTEGMATLRCHYRRVVKNKRDNQPQGQQKEKKN
jgi:hypothetical protein